MSQALVFPYFRKVELLMYKSSPATTLSSKTPVSTSKLLLLSGRQTLIVSQTHKYDQK